MRSHSMKPNVDMWSILRKVSPESSPPLPAAPSDAAAPAAIVQVRSSSKAVTALVILLALFFLGFFSAYACRFFSRVHRSGRSSSSSSSYRRAHPQPPRRPRGSFFAPAYGLDPGVLRALPVLCYVGGEKEGCVVCLSEFEKKERVKVIPRCGHVFHPACIDAWLVSRGSCPLCRCTELFGSCSSFNSKKAELRLAAFELELELELEEGRNLEEEEEERSREGEKEVVTGLGRSSSWRRRRADEEGEEERVEVFLRRTCSL